MPFFGRIASTTDLPRILAEHYPCKAFVFHSRRLSFWHAKMELIPLETEEPEQIVQKANQWMEQTFTSDDDICADWLWMHDRWRILDHPNQRFALSHKKQSLDFEKITTGYRLWIRLDEDPEFAASTLPLIKALKKGRPDATITILLPQEIKGKIDVADADHVIHLPSLDTAYRLNGLQHLGDEFPDTHLLFTQSSHADQEALVIKTRQRFGLTFPNAYRPTLTHAFEGNPNEPMFVNYENMLCHFGLEEEVLDK